MNNQISSQANKLWRLVTDAGTIDSYKQALAVTWAILKETALLAWLALCLVLVVFDWFWNGSIAAGRDFRTWISSFESSDSNQIASQVGQGFLAAGKNSLSYAVSQAREQLGLPAKDAATVNPVLPPAPAPVASPPVLTPPPVVTPPPATSEAAEKE